jgi:hypothetical protein
MPKNKTNKTMIATLFFALLGVAATPPTKAWSQPAITDGSFSSPNVDTSPYFLYLNGEYGGWDFSSYATGTAGFPGQPPGNAGVAYDVNNWFLGTPPVGNQAAFLQSGGIISQTINNLVPGQEYQISLYAAKRPNYSSDPFIVEGDGSALLYVDPTQTNFTQYVSDIFYSNANSIMLSLNGAYVSCTPYSVSCDMDTAINDVVVSAVSPASLQNTSAIQVDEPGSLSVLLAAVFMLWLVARRQAGVSSSKFSTHGA